MAVDNSLPNVIVYKAADGTYRLLNTATLTERVLQGADSIPHLYNWAVDNNNVFVEGGWLGSKTTGYADCPVDCIWRFDASGVRSNVSSSFKTGSYQQFPRVHNGFALWADYNGPNAGSYVLYNITTREYMRIAPPINVNYIGNTDFDFTVSNGVVTVFYYGQTGGSGTASEFDVFKWSSTTKASEALSSGGARNIYPRTDGTRVAWTRTDASSDGLSTLMIVPVGSSFTVAASFAMLNYKMAGGVLAWTEGQTVVNSTSRYQTTSIVVTGLKMLGPTGAATLITYDPTAALHAVCSSGVVFSVQGKFYFTSTTNVARPLLDATPDSSMMSGATLYFSKDGIIYKMQLA